ncbi:type VI secretion system baseplate subunit TssE [Acetobacteraceae bacterium]|nr:type VI secretion system baseplate subunit TssE [Acetobacteraceae bacterium]
MDNFSSLLDHLHDGNPKQKTDLLSGTESEMDHLVSSISFDLERLLNSRSAWSILPKECRDLKKSFLGFGLNDLKMYAFSNEEDLEIIRQNLEDLLLLFEPRLSHVNVILMPQEAYLHGFLPIVVEATLCPPYRDEAVYFDISLKISEE